MTYRCNLALIARCIAARKFCFGFSYLNSNGAELFELGEEVFDQVARFAEFLTVGSVSIRAGAALTNP